MGGARRLPVKGEIPWAAVLAGMCIGYDRQTMTDIDFCALSMDSLPFRCLRTASRTKSGEQLADKLSLTAGEHKPTLPLAPGTPKVILQSPSNFNTNFMKPSRNPPSLSNRRANCSAFMAHLKHVNNLAEAIRPSFIPLPVLPESHKGSALRPPDHTKEIRVVMIRTKKRIPGGAVVRNRTSRRVFEAFKTCIQRRNMARQLLSVEGALLVILPTKEAYERPMDLLVEDAKEALISLNLDDINRKAPSSPDRQKSKRSLGDLKQKQSSSSNRKDFNGSRQDSKTERQDSQSRSAARNKTSLKNTKPRSPRVEG